MKFNIQNCIFIHNAQRSDNGFRWIRTPRQQNNPELKHKKITLNIEDTMKHGEMKERMRKEYDHCSPRLPNFYCFN